MTGDEPRCFEYEPRSKLWRWREHWSGDIGKYQMGRYSAIVQDMDGDGSVWEVKVDDQVVGSGSFYDADYWDRAIAAVEDKLVELGALCRPPARF